MYNDNEKKVSFVLANLHYENKNRKSYPRVR
jgi:hypothetical protein